MKYNIYKLVDVDASLIKDIVFIEIADTHLCDTIEIIFVKQNGHLSVGLLNEDEFINFFKGHSLVSSTSSYIEALEKCENILNENKDKRN